MAEPYVIECVNFTAGPNLENYIVETMEQVLGTAPYGAKVVCTIELTADKTFHAIFKLDIGTTRNITNVSDPDVEKCLLKAFGQMRSDISRYRRDRAVKANKKQKSEFEALQLEKKKSRFSDGKKGD